MIKDCYFCGRRFSGRTYSKYCSAICTGQGLKIDAEIKRSAKFSEPYVKVCKYCGKLLTDTSFFNFCDENCAINWRIQNLGTSPRKNDLKKYSGKSLKEMWQDPEFRANNFKRMTENNPVYQPGVVERTKKTILKNGGYKNYFKYGNGKMSVYEQIAWETLKELGFEYNQAINTYIIRQRYPEKHIGFDYKSDFLHRTKKLCIEIDGPNHSAKNVKKSDEKKDWCLSQLGYKIVRFTHEDIDNGKLGEYLKQWQS